MRQARTRLFRNLYAIVVTGITFQKHTGKPLKGYEYKNGMDIYVFQKMVSSPEWKVDWRPAWKQGDQLGNISDVRKGEKYQHGGIAVEI